MKPELDQAIIIYAHDRIWNSRFLYFVFFFFHLEALKWFFIYDYYMQSRASKCIIELGTVPLATIEKFTDVSFAFLH